MDEGINYFILSVPPSVYRILFEKRQANDAIELLRVLTRSSGVTLEIHRDMDSASGGVVGDPVQVTLLRQ